MTTYKNNRGRWAVDVTLEHPDGRVERVRKTAPVQTKRAAEQYEREVREALLAGKRGKPMPTLAEFWPEYMATAELHNKASSLAAKRSLYRNHLEPYFGGMRLDAIGTREIDGFTAHTSATLHAKSVNNALTILHHALDTAVQWEILKSAPRVKWLRPPKPEFRFLDFDEAERLVHAAANEPDARAMIVLALNTGLRLGELLALEWADVDLAAGRLHVRRAVALGVVATPKGGRSREVPLNSTATCALRVHRLRVLGDLVFPRADGRMLTQHEARYPLWRAARRAGLGQRLGWHALRHTFASHLVMRGVALKAVQELLGHATIEMTMVYAHLSPVVGREAVRMLDQHSGNTPSPNAEKPAQVGPARASGGASDGNRTHRGRK